MQDAVNPIESLETWTEFVEGKNKVWLSHATDWQRRRGREEGRGRLLAFLVCARSSGLWGWQQSH